jgi:alkaline phosphatase D
LGATHLSRRGFVGAALAGGAVAAVGGPLRAADIAGARARRHGLPRARDVRFSQGVASGEPNARAATLWTRVDGLDRPATVRLEVATDAGFRRVVLTKDVPAIARDGYSVKERVGGLKPHEQYHYRFFSKDGESDVGHFRTMPPDGSREPVQVAFFSCQDWQAGYYTSHADLADQDVDLIVCLGDYIYERNYYPGPRIDKTGKNRDGEVQTLPEYREKYALYHTDSDLRAIRRSAPIVAIWDDHEVEDNWAGELPGEYTMDLRVPFLARRRHGFRAFFEHMPMKVDPRDPTRIYDSHRLGKNVELFLLDERQYRSDQPCNDTALLPCDEDERNDPRRTLLGKRQTSWFKRALRRSDATWKAVANQVMVMSLDLPNGSPINPDQWDGYGANRDEVLGYIQNKGLSDIVFFTGDIHTFFAGNVLRSGRQRLLDDERPLATEFVCGSVTSLGLLHVLKEQVGIEVPEDIASLALDGPGIPLENPHIRYSNLVEKGYAIAEFSKEEMRVSFRAPTSVSAPKSPSRNIASFVVERGDPRVRET